MPKSARKQSSPKKNAGYHRAYCPGCRVDYYSRTPGKKVISFVRGQRRYYKGPKPPSLRYFAANAVRRRNLFKYRAPGHSH